MDILIVSALVTLIVALIIAEIVLGWRDHRRHLSELERWAESRGLDRDM